MKEGEGVGGAGIGGGGIGDEVGDTDLGEEGRRGFEEGVILGRRGVNPGLGRFPDPIPRER